MREKTLDLIICDLSLDPTPRMLECFKKHESMSVCKLKFANKFTTLVISWKEKKGKPIQCPRGMSPPKGRGCPHHMIPKAPHRPHKRTHELPCPTHLPFLPISRCSRAQQSQFQSPSGLSGHHGLRQRDNSHYATERDKGDL